MSNTVLVLYPTNDTRRLAALAGALMLKNPYLFVTVPVVALSRTFALMTASFEALSLT